MSVFIHETAVVDPGAKIGDGSKIWHFSHVCGGSVLGDRVSCGQNIYVGAMAVIGNDCKIQNNVSIYDNVVLEDNVFCGPSVVFTNVHNPRAFIERKDEYRKTLVCRGASLGANSTIVCGVSIGEYAFIGAGAVITSDVPAFALMVGVPAKQIGWMSRFGDRINLPLEGLGCWYCEKDKVSYELKGNKMECIS